MLGVAKLARGEGNVGLLEVPEPTLVPGHVIIEVKAAGVCGTDLHIYHDEFPTEPPVIMGHELAGVVAEIGEGVTRCQVGDRVTSETYFYYCDKCEHCRNGFPNLCLDRLSIGSGVNGAFAKYVLVPERNIHHLPENVEFHAGALSEPVACCVHALQATPVEAGDLVIVSGPGAMGLIMAQVAKANGATVAVLGTTADAKRMVVAKELGMDRTIDVQTEDALAIILEMSDGRGADVAYECAGVGPSAQTCLDLLKRRGLYGQVGLFGRSVTWDLEKIVTKHIIATGTFAHIPIVWPKALKLMETGLVKTEPIATHQFPLADWQKAFDAFGEKNGLKSLLIP